MLDLKFLRESSDQVRKGIRDKGIDCDLDHFLGLDQERRATQREFDELRGQQKNANSEMAGLPKGSEEFKAKIAEMKTLSRQVKEKEESLRNLETDWKAAYLSIPNIPHATVPVAPDPSGNEVYSTWGDPEQISAAAKPHYDLPGFSQIVDFHRGSKVTGGGFPFFVGEGAKLCRALIQFFLDEAGQRGYTEVLPPLFVNAASATATGQLPDKEGQMYHMTVDELYAIPTAEVPVTNFYREEIFSAEDLPRKVCAYSPCFRREAGSHGKDVRGLNRMHQFDKVELVKWVHPEKSYDELEELKESAEALLQKLELPYRVLLMCSGDLGFTQTKKYDLEVWSGGQKRWLEVSSCSNFEAFQARRAQTRFRNEEGKVEPVHTLNGSALALPRVISALLENNLRDDGTVVLPKVLQPYLGSDRISLGQ